MNAAVRLRACVGSGAGTPSCTISSPGRDLAAERRDLDHLRAELDVREPEAAADDPAVAEQLLDLIRMRRRADVEILRAGGRAAGRGRCRRRGRRCGRPAAGGRGPSARPGRCRGARSGARRAERSSVRPSSGIVPKASRKLTKPLMPNDLGLNFGCATIARMRRVGSCSACSARCAARRARAADARRSAGARPAALQPAAVRGGDRRRRAGAADAGARRRRRSRSRRAPISSASARARRADDLDQRARAAAPASIRERFPPRERAEFIVGLGEALYLRRRVRRRGGRVRVGAAQPASCCRPTRASACSTGGRARSIATRSRGRRSNGRRSISGFATRMDDELATRSRQRRPPPTGWRRRRAARAICRRRGTRRRPAGCARRWPPIAASTLRADLDRLVLRAIVPERAKALGAAARDACGRSGSSSRSAGRASRAVDSVYGFASFQFSPMPTSTVSGTFSAARRLHLRRARSRRTPRRAPSAPRTAARRGR